MKRQFKVSLMIDVVVAAGAILGGCASLGMGTAAPMHAKAESCLSAETRTALAKIRVSIETFAPSDLIKARAGLTAPLESV